MRRLFVILGTLAAAGVLSAAHAQPSSKPNSPVYRACPAEMVWREVGGGCVCAAGLR